MNPVLIFHTSKAEQNKQRPGAKAQAMKGYDIYEYE